MKHKETKFKSHDDCLNFLQDGKTIRNINNFHLFHFEHLNKRIHLGRYFLLQKENGDLFIKYKTTYPTETIVAYANFRHNTYPKYGESECY